MSVTSQPSRYKRGVHVFQVKAIDKAGLVSEVASYSWTSENVGPQITLSLVTPSPYYSPANVEIKYAVLKSQFADISSVSCGLSTAIKTGCVNEAQISLSNLKTGSYTYKVTAKDSAGNSSEQTINFTVLDQPCELSAQTVPVKVIFIVDTSNSNVAYYETQAPTDPTKSFRTAEIKTMYDSYKNKSNFSWGFITFKGGLAYNLIGSDTSTPIFGNSAAMATAMTTFANFSDGGRTPYAAALSMASSLIAGDKNKTADTKYIAVFLSDGEPSDGSTADSLKIGVKNLIDQAKGQVTMSTVFYGYSNKTASDRMTEMALNGGGQFVDMTVLPTGTVIDIKDIINLPGPGCK